MWTTFVYFYVILLVIHPSEFINKTHVIITISTLNAPEDRETGFTQFLLAFDESGITMKINTDSKIWYQLYIVV